MLDLAPSKWQESTGIKGIGLELDRSNWTFGKRRIPGELAFPPFYSKGECRIAIPLELLQIKNYT